MHTPYGRDVVKQLAAACHEANMPLGIYYSPRDWHHPDYGIGDNAKYVAYMNGQLRELLTNYGKVNILWFDSYGRGDLKQVWKIGEDMGSNQVATAGAYRQQQAGGSGCLQPSAPPYLGRHGYAGATARIFPEHPSMGIMYVCFPSFRRGLVFPT